MLVLLSDKGAPSEGKILSIYSLGEYTAPVAAYSASAPSAA